jgi:integrase
MLSTGITIESGRWDKRKNRAKPGYTPDLEAEAIHLNRHLDRIQTAIIQFFGERHGNRSIDRQDLKSFLKYNLDGEQNTSNQVPEDIFSVWEHIIETTKNEKGLIISSGTKRSKMQTFNKLKEYCSFSGSTLTFLNFDMRVYQNLDSFMISQGLNDNTRGKHFKEIKAVFREAEDRDIPVNHSFRKKSFKVIRSQPENVYLNSTELKQLFQLKLTPGQARLRDIFVMACYTGARHSDWHKINKDNLVVENGKEMLRISQKKTGDIIHIPLHPAVRQILAKYNGYPPQVITNQKFNEGLKAIAKKAALGSVTIGGQQFDKSELITTHTARRSFATNAYLSRTLDVHQIMRCTGHKSESSFLRYLKLDGKDYAIQAADANFFKDETWSSMKIAS